MSQLLTDSLQGSLLLRPWYKFSTISSTTWQSWLKGSFFSGCVASSDSEENVAALRPTVLQKALSTLFFLGVVLLLIILAFLGTGMIGAAVVVLLLLGILLRLLAKKANTPLQITSIDILVFAFLGSAALSTAFSSYFYTSLIGLGKFLIFASGYWVFRCVTLTATPRKVVTRLLWVLALLGFFEAVVGFYQYVMHIQPLATWSDPSINTELKMDRIFGTLKPSNPNLLAGFLTPCLASALGLTMLYLKKNTWFVSLGMAVVSVSLVVAMVLTGSRGSFLALGAMFICVFAYAGHLVWHEKVLQPYSKLLKGAWIGIIVISLLAATAGILGSEKIRARAASMFSGREDSSISFRMNVYQSSMKMAKDNIVIGIGPGNSTFKLVYGLYMVPGYSGLGAYSVPLEITVEQGLIGLFIFLSLLFVAKIRTLIIIDNPAYSIERKIILCTLFTGIAGCMAYGIFDTIWYRPAVNLVFWFLMASLSTLSESQPDSNIFKGLL
jgi:putative inorganic carbon (hco3(-)) transporter